MGFTKMFIALFVIWSSALCIAAPANDPAWKAYKTKFGKIYTDEEDAVRYGIWKKRVAKIERFNEQYADTYGYTQGINQLSDMSLEEFRETIVTSKFDSRIKQKNCKPQVTTGKTVPNSINWREEGYVTEVKNQCKNGLPCCKSSYAFAATGALEAQVFKKTDKLISLSAQQIVDCSCKPYLNERCKGGSHTASFDYLKLSGHGIESEENYRYEGYFRKCRCGRRCSKVVANLKDFCIFNSDEFKDPQKKEDALKKAVAEVGPISVAITVKDSFVDYDGGIYYDDDCSDAEEDLSHHVLVVGYGTDSDGVKYWLVKYSRGKDWGEDGYIRMRRNEKNMCGIATLPSYPILY